MLYLVALSIAVTVGLFVFLVAQLAPARARPVQQRIDDLSLDTKEALRQRRQLVRKRKIEQILAEVGDQVQIRVDASSKVKRQLMAAGYTAPGAEAYFWGIRIFLTGALAGFSLLLIPLLGVPAAVATLLTIYFAAMGWFMPQLIVSSRMRRRQKQLQKALPDALDLMVVCVEAGLGLNQALKRVAVEMAHVSEQMSRELTMVNLEIRAGTARDAALQNLARRTGLADIQSLVTMLIQTDRFGTSIAKSLRVHSETLRTKRRQRAEEAAAKTTIKMVFPLVLCIFPAMFVVILGGGLIQIIETLRSL